MRVRRILVCILAIVAIAIVNIYHQALAVQYGYELGRLQTKSAQLRVSIAALEGRVTMLASPSRLKAENDRLQLGLVAPSKWQQPPTAVASMGLAGESERGLVRR
jgi:hypothetical protein